MRGRTFDVGGYEEIGAIDATRGMQGLAALQKALGAAGGGAPGFAAGHVPDTLRLRSQYKDSTQFAINITQLAVTSAQLGTLGISVSGNQTMQKHFKPEKLYVQEVLMGHITLSSSAAANVPAAPALAADCDLTGAFSGNDNCFPYAPSPDQGTNCSVYTPQSLGNAISWPTVAPGIKLTLQFQILPTVTAQIALPTGATFVSVDVTIKSSIFGEQLR